MVVDKAFYNQSTLPHEIGHCLNLFHTHHGVEPGGCLENINGSNCNTCGDYICDTPADPTCIVNGSCTYIGGATQNGILYTPDTRNIMSYSNMDCRNKFSAGQGERMYASLKSISILQNVVVQSVNGLPISNIYIQYSRNMGTSQPIDFGTSNSKTIFTQTGNFSVTASTPLSGTNIFNWVVTGPPPGSGYGWSNFTKSGPNCSFRLSGTNAPTIPLQVTLTNTPNGCNISSSNSKYVVFVASIPGGNLRSVVASPNPAGSKLNISLLTSADSSFTQKASSEITSTPSYKSYASQGKTVISLFEMSSHTLVRQWISNEVNGKSYQHDLSGIKKGLYVLQIDRDNETITTKIIKE